MIFKTCNKYKWKVVDEFGWDLTNERLRTYKIDSIDNEVLEVNYLIELSFTDDFGGLNAVFNSKEKKLKLYSTGHQSIRVNLLCENLEEAETLIDKTINGYDNSFKVSSKFINN